MSKMSNYQIMCPECGTTQEVTAWNSVNVYLDPNLRDQIFAGEINQFVCSLCGHKAFLDIPLLYHDMEHKFCVQYLSPRSMDDPDLA